MPTETKAEYIARMMNLLAPQMAPVLEELTIPCSCGRAVCRGWKLTTMWRNELPPAALAKRPQNHKE